MKEMDRPQSAWNPLSIKEKAPGEPVGDGTAFAGLVPDSGAPLTVEWLSIPVLLLDANGSVLHRNLAAKELARALQVKDLQALFPEDFESQLRRCLQRSQAARVNSAPGNGRRRFTWYLVPDLEEGRVQVHGIETTERHRLLERLRKAEELEMVGRLAGCVAHDLANNLTVLQGHLGMVQSGQHQGPSAEESVRQCLRATERAGELVRQLFALRGIEAPTLRPVSLAHALGGFSGRLQRLLGEDVEVTFQIDPDLPPALSDEGRVQQLLTAAALRVRSTIPAGGTLTIELSGRQPFLDGEESRRFLCLGICGHGGLEASRSTLECELVPSLVAQLQGVFEVAAAPEFGWRLFLPAVDAESEDETRASRDPGCGTETVLLVEDEGPVRSILRMALERRGYHVVEAASGVEALAVWHQHHDRIALLVTDMVMPVGLSGRELAEQFRIQNPHLRALYVSGYTAEAAGLPVSLGAGEGYLRKPVDPDELTRAVRAMIDG